MRRQISLFAFVVVLIGCNKELPSAIVERVKRDGAGDVERASLASITEWVRGKGVAYADSLWVDCEPIKKSAPATWSDSTEGRVCTAAYTVRTSSFRPAPEGGRPKF